MTPDEKAHIKMLAQRFEQTEEETLELFKTLQSRHKEVKQ